MIFAIVRTAIAALRRDRASLALSFVLPIAFFTIFATIFGSQHNTVPRIRVIVVDEDQSSASRELLREDPSVLIRPVTAAVLASSGC